jgi:MFS family permease
MPAASFVAAVTSVATLGGAAGKVINGFVCQHTGGRKSSLVYLFGMASAAFLVSTLSDNYGLAFGAMEFCASVQWTACTVVLSNHYSSDAAGFSGTISSLALTSTAGIISCKSIGSAMLQHMSWRRVAQLGSMVAIMGSVVMHSVATEFPELTKPPPKEPFSVASIGDSFRAVLGSKLFWLAGMAHATAFLVRASDKILGSFFQEATSLPRKSFS